MKVSEQQLERPDIWDIAGAFTMAVDERVRVALHPFLDDCCELLPLSVIDVDAELMAVNVLRRVDCLSKGSWIEHGSGFALLFEETMLPDDGLFKVPELAVTETFVVERQPDGDSFRKRLQLEDLKGIALEPVWSNTGGAIEVGLLRF